MFAKLKQKLNVDSVAGGDRPEMTPDKYGSMVGDMAGLHFSNSKETSSDAESAAGDTLSPSSNNLQHNTTEDRSKEEVLYMLMKRTEQVKKLERKVGDLASIVREKNKNVDKLELTVETERHESSQRIQDLVKQHELKDAAIKEEKDLSKMQRAQLRYEEESHAECRSRLDQSTQSTELLEQRSATLQAEVYSLSGQRSRLTERSDELQEDVKKKGSLIEDLTTERQALKKCVDKLQDTLTAKVADMTSLACTHADLQDSHQTLQHSMELHKKKMSSLLEEKDEQLSNTRERTRLLEQRLQDSSLSDDERFTAIEIERNSLELRLTETREQLIQVKSSWSDKITLLEKQIGNLNSKMAEDSEEFRIRDTDCELQISELRAQVASLSGQLENADKAADASQMTNSELCRSLKKQNTAVKTELEEEREKCCETERILTERISSLEAQTKTLQKARDQHKATVQQKMAQIESRQSEWLEKEIDAERCRTEMGDNITCIQQENVTLRNKNEKLLAEIHNHENAVEKLTETVCDLESGQATLHGASEETHSLLRATQLELKMCSKEKSELLLRNAQLFQDVEVQRSLALSTQAEMEHARKQAAADATQLQDSLKYHKEKADTLEEEHNDVNGQVNSEEVDCLQGELAELNVQLTEKNKTIKMQQQRLADLKKTLQRELKIQALPNGTDSPPEPSHHLGRATSETCALSRLAAPPGGATSAAILQLSNAACAAQMDSETSGAAAWQQCERPCCSAANCGEYITDVNFQYLKHVMLKFMLSRETEAKQLIKAVSTLLRFSHEEQVLIQQTLNWKSSWFAMRPELGHGQKSHVVPSSY